MEEIASREMHASMDTRASETEVQLSVLLLGVLDELWVPAVLSSGAMLPVMDGVPRIRERVVEVA